MKLQQPKTLTPTLLTLLLLTLSTCTVVPDMWGSFSSSIFTCVKGKGYNKIILKLDSRQTYIESSDIRTILAARNVGLEVEPAMTPCMLKSPAAEAERIVKSFPEKTFTKLWAVPWQTDNSCAWHPYYPKDNCKYLQQFIATMRLYGIDVGVGTNKNFWSQLFGGIQGCPQVGVVDLWWEPVGSQIDGRYDFGSYRKIGGWKLPYSKQVTQANICGYVADLNYYP